MGDVDDGECYCEAWSPGECACGNYPFIEVDRKEWQALIPRWEVTLGANLELAASLAAMHRIGYTKGFDHGKLLAEFFEDYIYIPEPYFPTGDTRPTAERLGWSL